MTPEEVALIMESVDAIAGARATAERHYLAGDIDRSKGCWYRANATRGRLKALLESMVPDV